MPKARKPQKLLPTSIALRGYVNTSNLEQAEATSTGQDGKAEVTPTEDLMVFLKRMDENYRNDKGTEGIDMKTYQSYLKRAKAGTFRHVDRHFCSLGQKSSLSVQMTTILGALNAQDTVHRVTKPAERKERTMPSQQSPVKLVCNISPCLSSYILFPYFFLSPDFVNAKHGVLY